MGLNHAPLLQVPWRNSVIEVSSIKPYIFIYGLRCTTIMLSCLFLQLDNKHVCCHSIHRMVWMFPLWSWFSEIWRVHSYRRFWKWILHGSANEEEPRVRYLLLRRSSLWRSYLFVWGTGAPRWCTGITPKWSACDAGGGMVGQCRWWGAGAGGSDHWTQPWGRDLAVFQHWVIILRTCHFIGICFKSQDTD